MGWREKKLWWWQIQLQRNKQSGHMRLHTHTHTQGILFNTLMLSLFLSNTQTLTYMHAHTLKALACLHCSPVLVSLIYFQPSFSDSDHLVPFIFYVHLLSSLYLCNSSCYLSHTENSGSSDRKCDVEGKEEEMKRKIGGENIMGGKCWKNIEGKKWKRENEGLMEGKRQAEAIRGWRKTWMWKWYTHGEIGIDTGKGGNESKRASQQMDMRERQWEREREQERKRSWR